MTLDPLKTIDIAMGIVEIDDPQTATIITPSNQTTLCIETGEQRKDDHEFVRTKLRNVIEDAADGFADIMELAKSSESPRAFEVAANFANTIAAVSKNLMELHKETQKQAPSQQAQTINNVNQVFTGTNAELLKLLRSNG